jgi:hypothetical protein
MRQGVAIYAGGNYVFYIAGILDCLCEHGLRHDAIATYSAGAALVPGLLSGRVSEAYESYLASLDAARRPGDDATANRWTRPFPHDALYSRLLDEFIDFDVTRRSPYDVRVIVSTFSAGALGARLIGLGGLLALGSYAVTRRLIGRRALAAFKRLAGIEPLVVDLRHCQDRAEAIRLVLGSSTVYPFLRLRTYNKRYMLDGKFSLVSPIAALDDCTHIVSVHAYYTFPDRRPGVVQLAPTEPLGVGPFELPEPGKLRALYQRGRADGERHMTQLLDLGFAFDQPRRPTHHESCAETPALTAVRRTGV